MSERRTLTVPGELAGQRLDRVLATLMPEYSRSRLQAWIRSGQVRIGGAGASVRQPVEAGAELVIEVPPQEGEHEVLAQPIALRVCHEDEDLLIIDKPAGMVVHPAAGNRDGTLQNALLHHDPGLAGVPRAGIVHRLDKDTSGLLVVARTLRSHTALVRQLAERAVRREYLALVSGEIVAGATISAPIGRHPVDRKRMAVVAGGKGAQTSYRIEERLRGFTLLRVSLHTGRTHQIRVHLQHAGMPIVGDRTYGTRARYPKGLAEPARCSLDGMRRQALHAARLGLMHPSSGETMVWTSALPDDISGLLEALRAR